MVEAGRIMLGHALLDGLHWRTVVVGACQVVALVVAPIVVPHRLHAGVLFGVAERQVAFLARSGAVCAEDTHMASILSLRTVKNTRWC